MEREIAPETEITEPLKRTERHQLLQCIKSALETALQAVLHPERELSVEGFLQHFEALPVEYRTYGGRVLSGEEVLAAIPNLTAFNKELSGLEVYHLLGIDSEGRLVIADADRELMQDFPQEKVNFVKTPLNFSTPQS